MIRAPMLGLPFNERIMYFLVGEPDTTAPALQTAPVVFSNQPSRRLMVSPLFGSLDFGRKVETEHIVSARAVGGTILLFNMA
jgi:hypothetical protein